MRADGIEELAPEPGSLDLAIEHDQRESRTRQRHRPQALQEFDERRSIPAAELRSRLRGVVQRADEVIGAVGSNELLSRRQIQGYDVTVLEAIYHVVEHFGMHTGQIIMLSKARLDRQLNLWESPPP